MDRNLFQLYILFFLSFGFYDFKLRLGWGWLATVKVVFWPLDEVQEMSLYFTRLFPPFHSLPTIFPFRSLNPYLVNRFQAAFATGPVALKQIKGVTFVIINSMALEGDDCFLCKPATDKIKIIGRKCGRRHFDFCVGFVYLLLSFFI